MTQTSNFSSHYYHTVSLLFKKVENKREIRKQKLRLRIRVYTIKIKI